MVWHMTSKRSAPASSRQCPGGRAVGRPRGRGDHAAAMYAPYGKRPDPSLLYGLVYTVAAVGALLWLLVLRAVQSRGRSAPILAVVVTPVHGALDLLLLSSGADRGGDAGGRGRSRSRPAASAGRVVSGGAGVARSPRRARARPCPARTRRPCPRDPGWDTSPSGSSGREPGARRRPGRPRPAPGGLAVAGPRPRPR